MLVFLGGFAYAGPLPCGVVEAEVTLGRTDDATRACLLAAADDEARPEAEQRAALQLALADAWATGRTEAWHSLVDRHAALLLAADPDALYALAMHGDEDAPAPVRHPATILVHADRALAHADVWTDPAVQAARVSALQRVRARAAVSAWRTAGGARAVAEDAACSWSAAARAGAWAEAPEADTLCAEVRDAR